MLGDFFLVVGFLFLMMSLLFSVVIVFFLMSAHTRPLVLNPIRRLFSWIMSTRSGRKVTVFRRRKWGRYKRSSVNKTVIIPILRTSWVTYYLTILLHELSASVAIGLWTLVIGSSVLLYVQGRLLARFIGAIYHDSGVFGAMNMFFLAMIAGMIVTLLIKKTLNSQRFHIREFFDPITSETRADLGMKAFTYPHKNELNEADSGSESLKYFPPQQVAFISQFMNVLLGVGFLVVYAPVLLIVLVFTLPVLLLIDLYLAAKAADIEQKAWDLFGECTQTKHCFTYPERLKGTMLFGMVEPLINHIKKRSHEAFSSLRKHNWSTFWVEFASVAAMCVLMYVVIWASLTVEVTPEIHIFLITTSLSITASAKRLSESFADQLISSERIVKVLRWLQKERAKKAEKANLAKVIAKAATLHVNGSNEEVVETLPAGDLEFRNLTLGYVRGKNIIEDSSVIIPANSKVLVFGENGCGKSTLFAYLSGLYDFNPGQAFLGGVDLSKVPRPVRMRELRQLVQDTATFPHKFCETLAYSTGKLDPSECSEELMIEVLKMAMLDGKVLNSPNGLEQSLFASKVKGTDNSQEEFSLSGGEKKRLNHAQFYIGLIDGKVKVAILDEPYNNIDPQISHVLEGNVDSLPGIRLVATHTARYTVQDNDLVLFFEKRDTSGGPPRSQLIFDTHGRLLARPAYRHYLAIEPAKAAVA